MNLQITIQTPTKKKKNISHSEQDVWTKELYQTNNKGAVERGAKKYRNITRQIPLELVYMN